eukprot:UC4_evm6s1505
MNYYNLDYCNPENPLEDRINMIMKHMTIEDKMKTMAEQGISGNYGAGNIAARPVSWWNEALHGVCRGCIEDKCYTQFPEANAFGSSFNSSLFHLIGDAISTEARAAYNVGGLNGLTFFTPQINMASNPLWGRNMECTGEDPYLTSVYAYEYVTGFQYGAGNRNASSNGGILKGITTPKHFTGQMFEGDGSNPYNNGTTWNRQSNDTRYPLHDLEFYYLPAFKAAMVDAGAGSVMCAYQSVNGVPMCANGFILNRVVRNSWGWKGFVVSDCDAIKTMMIQGSQGGNPNFGHAYSLTGAMAVQDGIRSGTDSNCGDPYRNFGSDAISDGLVTEEHLNASIRRLLRPHFLLGLFDPPSGQPDFTHFNLDNIATTAHKDLALDAARQSIVLLQNPASILPLSLSNNIFIVGPHAEANRFLLGNYNGDANEIENPRQAIERIMQKNVTYIPGVVDACTIDERNISGVLQAAPKFTHVIAFLGGGCHEGEGTDRDFLHLPGSQAALFTALEKINITIVVVIIKGGPISIDEIKGSDKTAILDVGFPGQAGGTAIAECIFGIINPSGKLTSTIYPGTYANGEPIKGVPWMDSAIRQTTYWLSWDQYDSGQDLHNTGKVAGKEVILQYLIPGAADPLLKKRLIGFEGANLNPGEEKNIDFEFPTQEVLATTIENGDRVLFPGNYSMLFSRGHGDELEITFQIIGKNPIIISKFPSPWVPGHEITVDSCIEGTTDIVVHDESFVVNYKKFSISGESIVHDASGFCLTESDGDVILSYCLGSQNQTWAISDQKILNSAGCLSTSAKSASDLRTNVTVDLICSDSSSSKWIFDGGFIKSSLPGLCLAARSQGTFNKLS